MKITEKLKNSFDHAGLENDYLRIIDWLITHCGVGGALVHDETVARELAMYSYIFGYLTDLQAMKCIEMLPCSFVNECGKFRYIGRFIRVLPEWLNSVTVPPVSTVARDEFGKSVSDYVCEYRKAGADELITTFHESFFDIESSVAEVCGAILEDEDEDGREFGMTISVNIAENLTAKQAVKAGVGVMAHFDFVWILNSPEFISWRVALEQKFGILIKFSHKVLDDGCEELNLTFDIDPTR